MASMAGMTSNARKLLLLEPLNYGRHPASPANNSQDDAAQHAPALGLVLAEEQHDVVGADACGRSNADACHGLHVYVWAYWGIHGSQREAKK